MIYCDSLGGSVVVSYTNTVKGSVIPVTDINPQPYSTGVNSQSSGPPSSGIAASMKGPPSTSGAASASPNSLPTMPAGLLPPHSLSDHRNLSSGTVAGIAIGTALTCIFLMWATTCFLLRRRRRREMAPIELKDVSSYGQGINNDDSPTGAGSQKISEVEDASPQKAQVPWSPTSLNRHPVSPELASREINTMATPELDSTPVTPATPRFPPTSFQQTLSNPFLTPPGASRRLSQGHPAQLTPGMRDGQPPQSMSSSANLMRDALSASPLSPIFSGYAGSSIRGASNGGTPFSKALSVPNIVNDPQMPRPRIPTSRNSSLITGNGGGPYLTAADAIDIGYWGGGG